jgi:hypothetical protein
MNKNIIALMVIALLSAGCAEPTWKNQSQSEISSWRDAGVTVNDYQKFIDAKMTSSNVLKWKNSGFKDTQTILDWHKNGFSAKDAEKWNSKGITLDVAKEWVENKFTFEEAMDWIGAKFSMQEAIENRAKGLVPNK